MQIDNVIAKGQLVPLVFMQADVAASQSAAALAVAEVRDTGASADDQNAAGGYVMPFDGQVVAVTVRASTARTAGTLTVDAQIGGTAVGLTAALNATDTQSKVSKQPREADRFAAGAVIGAQITTDGSWAPVTADVVVVVWVLLELSGI